MRQFKQLKRNNFEQGFTLIEVTVVIGLVALSSFVLADLFLGQNKIYKTQTAELNISNDARASLDQIDSYVRQSMRALSSFDVYSAGPQVLILQIQSVNLSDQLLPGTFDHVVIRLDGTNLYSEVFPHAASGRSAGLRKLASNVTGLAFTYDSSDFAMVRRITTDITIQEPATYQTRAITISSTSKLRNY